MIVTVVVMDNATIHHSVNIVGLIESKGTIVVLIYFPPYSPDLIPIELMFGEFKKGFKDWAVHMIKL